MEEGSGAGGLDPTQAGMAGPLPAQPTSSPTSQGKHSPCHTCLDFLLVVVKLLSLLEKKKKMKTVMN